MRLRKKPWARSALESCVFFVENPALYAGKWHTVFGNGRGIWLELGCGKGGFISSLATAYPDKNFIGVDIKDEVLVLAKEKIEKAYAAVSQNFDNIRITAHQIMIIHEILQKQDEVERIYINFCNPWTKKRREPKRLTHPNQLRQYKSFLKEKGQIWFKTDNEDLFRESFKYYEACGFEIDYMTEDLHKSGFSENIETEHEQMYVQQGKSIKFLIAKKGNG